MGRGSIRTAKIQGTDNTKCWGGHGAAGALTHCWKECKMAATLKTIWQFLTKPNILFNIQLSKALLGICWSELKTCIHTKTCSWIVIAALFIISKTCKQWRRSSAGKWIHPATPRQRRAKEENELSNHEKTWKNLKCTFLNGRNQSRKATHCIIPTM